MVSRRALLGRVVFGLLAAAAGVLIPAQASACGGFFCNSSQPVNQAAESIVFADNGDGTISAVIQIQYQGPSQNFSWLLPISSVPKSDSDIGIASNIALQRLQLATNPNYTLNLRIEGECKERGGGVGCGASEDGAAFGSAPPSNSTHDSGVTVAASGVVGAFEWSVISLDPNLADPAAAAVEWLKGNGYDVPSGAPALLGPYLDQGLNLLALRLTKGADAGSIRPIILTYRGSQPSIPVKLTAVAANDDMGVLTYVLGNARSVPQNYLSLELDEARINWLSPGTNYNAVVTAAANDAGGQGFVTELAGPTAPLAGQIWTTSDESNWAYLQGATHDSNSAVFNYSYQQFGQWDGFWDAVRASITLPAGVSLDALKSCPSCNANFLKFTLADYLAALDENVIQPVKRVQDLITAHPEITRMYTTLSADEMTLDPLFTFNPDLPDLSNLHTAERVVVCNPGVLQSDAPWHVELPSGGVVWGAGQTWPSDLAALPPNRVIARMSERGSGKVIEDNTDAIRAALTSINQGKATNPSAGGGCATGRRGRSTNAMLAVAVFGAALFRRRRNRRCARTH